MTLNIFAIAKKRNASLNYRFIPTSPMVVASSIPAKISWQLIAQHFPKLLAPPSDIIIHERTPYLVNVTRDALAESLPYRFCKKDHDATLEQINRNGPMLLTGESGEKVYCKSTEGNCQYIFDKRPKDNNNPYALFYSTSRDTSKSSKRRRALSSWANTLRNLDKAAKALEAATGYWHCTKCGHAWSTPGDKSNPRICEKPKCKEKKIVEITIEH